MILKREIIEQLSIELSLPFVGIEQDWDIEMADSNRISEFLKFYQCNVLSSEKKLVLMSLIIASYDDFLSENNIKIDSRWNEIKSILEPERIIFAGLIDKWSCINEKDNQNVFSITPFMRDIK